MRVSGVKNLTSASTEKKDTFVIAAQQVLPQPVQVQDRSNQASKDEVAQAVDKLNKAMGLFGNEEVRFSIHEQTKHMMIQIIKEDTGEVIAEYPPKKILDLVAKLQEMVGLIVDKQL